MRAARLARWIAGAALAMPLLLLQPEPGLAEVAWVAGEVKLNVRTGPSTDFRILATLVTGDRVNVLETDGSWTKIQTPSGEEGWIPAGYLEPQPPPTVRLTSLEAEVKSLRTRLDETEKEAAELRQANEALTARDEEQRGSLESLRAENVDLKAGARWPYLITGASLLAAGMLLGAIVSRASGRRKTRIRL